MAAIPTTAGSLAETGKPPPAFPRQIRMAPSTSMSVPTLRRGKEKTGSEPSPAKVCSSFYDCMARRNRSSIRPGSRAISTRRSKPYTTQLVVHPAHLDAAPRAVTKVFIYVCIVVCWNRLYFRNPYLSTISECIGILPNYPQDIRWPKSICTIYRKTIPKYQS